jgi:hypothetical protein
VTVRACLGAGAALYMRTVDTYQSNQWESDSFWRRVDHNEEQEIRVAAVYDRPVIRSDIRDQVLRNILTYAVPAGNA